MSLVLLSNIFPFDDTGSIDKKEDRKKRGQKLKREISPCHPLREDSGPGTLGVHPPSCLERISHCARTTDKFKNFQ